MDEFKRGGCAVRMLRSSVCFAKTVYETVSGAEVRPLDQMHK